MGSTPIARTKAVKRPTLRELIGAWEASLVREGTHDYRRTLNWMFRAVEQFFADHPRCKVPGQILITDVEDWKREQLKRYSHNTVRKYLCALKTFYSWLIRYQGFEIDNPVVIPPPHRAKPAQPGGSPVFSPPPPSHPEPGPQ
jgi:site-specific recombinase XerD